MNLLPILGAACLDPFFRNELFKDPATTLQTYNFCVGDNDLRIVREMCSRKDLNQDFQKLQNLICRKPPCPLPPGVLAVLGAALLDPRFRDELFEKPVVTANNYGFALGFTERYLLASLVSSDAKALKEAFEEVGRKIGPLATKLSLVRAA